MVLVTWVEKNPEDGLRILKAFFDAWFDEHPGRHPFERDAVHDLDMNSLGQIAQKSPIAFIAGTIEVLLRSIDEINRREARGERDYSFGYRTFSGHRFGADEFLGLFRSALRQVATADPTWVRRFLSTLDASKHEALLHLHLDAVSANGKALNGHLLEILGSDYLFDAGWDGADWKSFADAARAAFPYLSSDDRGRVETVIFSHNPEIDRAIRVAHEIKEHGESETWPNRRNVLSDLNRSGFKQWCVLETIGEDLLSQDGIQILKRLRRKFPGQKLPEPGDWGIHDVKPPIKRNKTALMDDENWLRAISRYDSENERRRGRGFTDGGARQLAGELQHATTENPLRFGALLKRIPRDAHSTYVSHILWGLLEAKEVEDDILQAVIFDAHNRPGRLYGNEIARLFEKCPKIAKDPSAFDVLVWYVENGKANGDEIIDTSDTEREIISIEDLLSHASKLHVRGINGARGWAAEVLGVILWSVPENAETLFNSDRLRCALLVERLVQGPSEVDGNNSGQERPHRFLSPDETMRMIGAWHVIKRSFQDPAYASEADRLIEEGEAYRRLAADVASHAITREEFRERAKSTTYPLF